MKKVIIILLAGITAATTVSAQDTTKQKQQPQTDSTGKNKWNKEKTKKGWDKNRTDTSLKSWPDSMRRPD